MDRVLWYLHMWGGKDAEVSGCTHPAPAACIQLKQWKSKRSIAIQLIRLGVSRKTAWRSVYDGRKSLWTLSHSLAVDRGLCNACFRQAGARVHLGEVAIQTPRRRCPGAARAVAGIGEFVNRPVAGVITRHPEEPCVNSTCTLP